jgi:large subunit ribosomal protein L24
MLKLRKGDTVAVTNGKDRGKRGKVLQVNPERGTALVERINLMKHFDRRTGQNQQGGIVEREVPLAIAKLMVVCPRCSKPTRIGIRVTEKARQRFCKRCQEVVGG